MRLLFAIIALSVYGISAGTVFACPFMTAAATHEEACSDCPKEESCPPEACILLCPYTVENTAVITSEDHHVPYVPVVASVFAASSLTRVHLLPRAHTREIDSSALYLRNRVLLI